jgi:hypothetical protein
MYRSGTNEIGFATSGVHRMSIEDDGHVVLAQKLTIGSDFRQTYGDAQFYSTCSFGGMITVTEMATINISDISTGENRGIRLINTSSGTPQQWNITTGITGSENDSFCIRDATNNVNAFTMSHTNGYIVAPGVYAGTSGGSANVHIASSGALVRSTSAKKYKKDIKPYNVGLSTLKQFKPITYKSKNEEDTKVYAGMLADDIHDLGLSEFVQYGEDEEVEGLSYDRLVTVCVNAIQELSAKVTALENA